MDDKATALLEQIATKLGTTSEYLWSILLAQAPIDATITLIQVILVILASVGMWKIHKSFVEKEKYRYNELLQVGMFLGAIILIILIVSCFFCISDIFNGYFNPEYWALDKVMDKVRPH